jgi:NarL family two-component system sensor histidine kinase YdfH
MTTKRKRTSPAIEPQLFQRLLLIALIGQYFWYFLREIVHRSTYSPWTFERWALFTGLFFIFFILHIGAQFFTQKRWRTILYVVIQSCLIFSLSSVADSTDLLRWLYLPLLGELILYSGSLWFAAFATAVMFGFSVVRGYIDGFYLGETYLDEVLFNVGWWAIWWALGQSSYVSALLLQLWGRQRAVNLLNELDMAHRQLAEYAIQVQKLTLNNERARMARELHDTLAQGLTGTILQLEALEAYLEIGDSTKAASIATQTKKRARAALADSRRAIDDLRLQPLEHMTLPELIAQEVSRFSEATGISYTLDLMPTLTLSPLVGEHLTRCISETLSNIARHAKATHISLSFFQKGDTLDVQISDNGVGFDVESATKLMGHYGLLGIRERVRLIGGSVDLDSKPGAGTTVSLHLKTA